MSNIKAVKATPEHAHYLAVNLREADLIEIRAGVSKGPLDSLLKGLELSYSSSTIVDENDTPLAIFGFLNGNVKDYVHPWLMASPEIEKHTISFLRKSKEFFSVSTLNEKELITMAHKDNTLHLKWLEWLGFENISREDSNEVFLIYRRQRYV